MFERFTDRGRRVVVLAREITEKLQNTEIAPAHIILGILQEGEALGARALLSLDLSYESVLEIVKTHYPPVENPPNGHIPATPSTKHLLELARRESLQLAHSFIGTEHILLAWTRIQDTPVFREHQDEFSKQLLEKVGKTPEEIRRHVYDVIAAADAPPRRARINEQPAVELPQVDAQTDFAVELEIPRTFQEDVIQSHKKLVAFLEVPEEDASVRSLSAIVAKLTAIETKISLQQYEMISYCTWYGPTLSHVVPAEHPFRKLYDLFMRTLHPGLYG